jgi:hypothetical protein
VTSQDYANWPKSRVLLLKSAKSARNFGIPVNFSTRKLSDIKYADLDQSTRYSRLTLRNIGQLVEMFSCLINYLRANAWQPTNQGVGSSNLSGRANNS